MAHTINASKLVKKAIDEKADQEVAKEKALEALVPTSLDKSDAYALIRRSKRKAIDLKGVKVHETRFVLPGETSFVRALTFISSGNKLNERIGGKLANLSLEVNWNARITTTATSAITIVQLWFGQLIGSFPVATSENQSETKITHTYWPTSESAINAWQIRKGYANKNFKIFKKYNLQFRRVSSTDANTKQGNNLSQCGSFVISADELGRSKMLDTYYYQVKGGVSDTTVNKMIVGLASNVNNVLLHISARLTYVC